MCAGVPEDMLYDVGKAITNLPEGFSAHRQIQKVYAARKEMVSSPESLVDWGMAEALAFGTLVAEGNHVRLSGQARSSNLHGALFPCQKTCVTTVLHHAY